MPAHDETGKMAVRNSPLQIVQDWYRTSDADLLSPSITWQVLDTFPSGGLYQGRKAIIDRFFPAVKAIFASYETHPATFMAEGESVITTGIYRVQGTSGVTADVTFAHLWTVRDGQITAFRQIADTTAINRASG